MTEQYLTHREAAQALLDGKKLMNGDTLASSEDLQLIWWANLDQPSFFHLAPRTIRADAPELLALVEALRLLVPFVRNDNAVEVARIALANWEKLK